MEELADKFLFRYVSNNRYFNINQLVNILKCPTKDMILDIKTEIKSKNIKALTFTPFIIDFDVKDEELFSNYEYDQLVDDIQDIIYDILMEEYELNDNNYDSELFNYLHSICDFDIEDNKLVVNEYDKNFDSFLTSIVQKKNNNKFNFHIIYPFVIIEDKDKLYDKIKTRLNKIYDIDFSDIIDNHLKTNSLRVINCSKKGRDIKDEYYIDINKSDVSDYFVNTERTNETKLNNYILKLNIMLCSLQWERCNLINGYTFTPINNEIIKSVECLKSNDTNKQLIINDEDELIFIEPETTKYCIDDIIYALDNFSDEYWKNQSYDEWRNTIWSCYWFDSVLNDQDERIYNKLLQKSKLYPGGINSKQFRQIWNSYDSNKCNKIRDKIMIKFKELNKDKYDARFGFDYVIVKEEIEEIKITKSNCNPNYLKSLLQDQKINQLIDYYIHYYFRTDNGYYYLNNGMVLRNEFKSFEDDNICAIININGNNKKVTIGQVIKDNTEKVKYFVDDGLTTEEYDNKPFLYKINYLNKNNEVVRYELHMNNSFISTEWAINDIFNYDYVNDPNNILNNQTIKENYDKIMYHIEHVICRDDKDKINYLMSFTKNIFNKRKNSTAPILYGDRRIGKSVFCQLFNKILPRLYCSSANGDLVKNDKSGVIFDNMVCVLEEVSDDFKNAAETCQRIKEYISSDTIGCRKLFHDQYQMINRTSFIINTNNIESIYFDSEYDARYVVFEVSNEYKENIKYFDNLMKAYNNKDVLRYFYWNVRNNENYNYNTRIALKTNEKTIAINKKFNSPYTKFFNQLFLEMHKLNTNEKIQLKDAWVLFKEFNYDLFNKRSFRDQNKMKDFNEFARNKNICICESDKHRNKRNYITYDKLQQYFNTVNVLNEIDDNDTEIIILKTNKIVEE